MSGYEIAHIDELERMPVDEEGLVWRPVRRRFGITAFGTNAYTAARAGDRVVEEHTESTNEHEELYVVLTGRATFTLDGTEVDAPAGTFVHVAPATKRGAVAQEDGTTVVGVGGRAGEPFVVSKWEAAFAAYGYQRLGDPERALATMREALDADPDAWQGQYHMACIQALNGNVDEAERHLRRAIELDDQAAKWASDDKDFDVLREAGRFPD
jgi:tetratricopeptide (TPR) repeat protein